MNLLNKMNRISNLVYRKQLLYRSRQRGWLEVDLILGSWAADNIMKLSLPDLNKYEKILEKETTEVYDLILNKKFKSDDNIINQIIDYVDNGLPTNTPQKYEQYIKNKMSN